MPGLVTLAVVFALLTVSVPAAGGKLGVMPASPDALDAAGLADPEVFTNSTAIEDPRLGFLGDKFAVPIPGR